MLNQLQFFFKRSTLFIRGAIFSKLLSTILFVLIELSEGDESNRSKLALTFEVLIKKIDKRCNSLKYA